MPSADETSAENSAADKIFFFMLFSSFIKITVSKMFFIACRFDFHTLDPAQNVKNAEINSFVYGAAGLWKSLSVSSISTSFP